MLLPQACIYSIKAAAFGRRRGPQASSDFLPGKQELMGHKLVFIETTDVVETTLALDNFRHGPAARAYSQRVQEALLHMITAHP